MGQTHSEFRYRDGLTPNRRTGCLTRLGYYDKSSNTHDISSITPGSHGRNMSASKSCVVCNGVLHSLRDSHAEPTATCERSQQNSVADGGSVYPKKLPEVP